MDTAFNDFLINTLHLPLSSIRTTHHSIPVDIVRKNTSIGIGWLSGDNLELKCICGESFVFFFDTFEGDGIFHYCSSCGENSVVIKQILPIIEDDLK